MRWLETERHQNLLIYFVSGISLGRSRATCEPEADNCTRERELKLGGNVFRIHRDKDI